MSLSQDWLTLFKPYQNKYVISVKSKNNHLFKEGFTTEYKTINERLTNELIEKALKGKKSVHAFSSFITKTLGFDIDDHSGSFEKGISPEAIKLYNYLVSELQCYPSFTFQSNRGLHCYYFLAYPIHSDLILFEANKKIRSIRSIEILPTPNHSLKIDPLENNLNPRTLEKEKVDFKNLTIYFPHELFGSEMTPNEYKLEKEKKKKEGIERARNTFSINRIEKLESEIMPILPTTSNDKYLQLIPAYYHSGLSELESLNRFKNLLWQSGYYRRGGKISEKQIGGKIRSSYRTFKRNESKSTFTGSYKNLELNLYDRQRIETLLLSSPFKRRNKQVTFFLEKLFGWINYHEEMSPREKSLWDWFHKGYLQKRKMDFIPLPKVIMESWNSRYYEIVEWLEDIKFILEKTNYQFGIEGNGKCRYFRFSKLIESRTDYVREFLGLLENSGMTLRQLGEKLGVHHSTISYWKNGKRGLSQGLAQSMLTKVKQ
ncbi:MAG: helix-turn-helix transcriptional regulator [Leptospiraceae bacterium]|nr:helix-turn-helix transcriptional regulator [Leptospiraceae bacterium]